MTSRREFLTKGLAFLAGGTVGVAAGRYGKIPFTEGDNAFETLRDLERYLYPGVSIHTETIVYMNDEGKKENYPSNSVNITLVREVVPHSDAQKVFNDSRLREHDISNLVNLISSVAGPYTLVAVVGSVGTRDRIDKAPSDIDVLVLNGSTEPYTLPNMLYDNQATRLRNHFHAASYEDIFQVVAQFDPEKAEIMKATLEQRRNEWNHVQSESSTLAKAESWYGTPHDDLFLLPGQEGFYNLNNVFTNERIPGAQKIPVISRPIHLIGAKNGLKENVAYNAELLREALANGKAVLLYQGEHNKLV